MESIKHSIGDHDIEKIMGNILRYGVLTSALIVLVGAFFYLYQHGNQLPQYREFIGEPKRFTEIKDVWKTALQGKGRSIIQLGLFVLIATPVARIIFSIIGYILEKDYLYIIITMIVLAVILYSLIR
jgi:uncharacterized membrane protein